MSCPFSFAMVSLAYDSVQLAAARSLQEMAGEEVQFACFDTRLCKAARTLGMASFP